MNVRRSHPAEEAPVHTPLVPPRLGGACLCRPLGILLSLSALAWGAAQGFNADTYYQQCLRFETGGDLTTARQSCLNALQANPAFADAELALGRIELALGHVGEAARRLQKLSAQDGSAESALLLAKIALQEGRLGDAEHDLARARSQLSSRDDRALASAEQFLSGQLAERRGDTRAALSAYHNASQGSLEPLYPLAEARLRLRLGDPGGAEQTLLNHLTVAATANPDMHSLLGHAYWAASRLESAAASFESALNSRSPRDTKAIGRDLRDLALVYYGQGDLQSGILALRSALRRGDLSGPLLSTALPWLLTLLVLVGLHLVGESRVAMRSGLELVQGPEAWTVGQVYGILFGALMVAAGAALGYSAFVYHNLLAVATPLQGADVRALFLTSFSLTLALMTLYRVRKNGWLPLTTLLGQSKGSAPGVLLGLLSLGVTVGYLAFAPNLPWLRGFYLDLSHLTPLLVAAVVLLPLAQLYFCAFAMPPLSRRYHPTLAVLISACLFALVFGAPFLLVAAVGLLLCEGYRRTQSGFTPVLAQWVFHASLVMAVALSGWVRALFL